MVWCIEHCSCYNIIEGNMTKLRGAEAYEVLIDYVNRRAYVTHNASIYLSI